MGLRAVGDGGNGLPDSDCDGVNRGASDRFWVQFELAPSHSWQRSERAAFERQSIGVSSMGSGIGAWLWVSGCVPPHEVIEWSSSGQWAIPACAPCEQARVVCAG